MAAGVPAHKLIPGCNFVVDGFRHAHKDVKAYFLSHAHSGTRLWMRWRAVSSSRALAPTNRTQVCHVVYFKPPCQTVSFMLFLKYMGMTFMQLRRSPIWHSNSSAALRSLALPLLQRTAVQGLFPSGSASNHPINYHWACDFPPQTTIPACRTIGALARSTAAPSRGR